MPIFFPNTSLIVLATTKPVLTLKASTGRSEMNPIEIEILPFGLTHFFEFLPRP